MSIRLFLSQAAGWFMGILAFTIGSINCFWGNDALFGIFISLLSFIYLPPVSERLSHKIGFAIPLWLKVLTGFFIIWAAVGVGELFTKIDMMLMDF